MTSEPGTDERVVLPDGALCFGCGYDLVGRTLDEKCPECGMDVAPSWPVTNAAAGHPVFLGQLLRECRRFFVVALLVWISTGITAGAATLALSPIAWFLEALLLISGVVAAWGLCMTPIMALEANKCVEKHPNWTRMPGAYERWNMHIAGRLCALGVVAFFVLLIIFSIARPTTGLRVLAACPALMAIGVLAWLLAAWTYTGSLLERSGRTAHAQWLEDTRLPIVVSFVSCVVAAVVIWKAFPISLAIVPWVGVAAGAPLVWRTCRAWRVVATLHQRSTAASAAEH